MLWRRLDTPGHDACRVEDRDEELTITGTAAFSHNGAAARLSYQLNCHPDGRTRRGSARGFVGTDLVSVAIERTASGMWIVNGGPIPGCEGHAHLDFGFTPATNFPHLRTLALAVGQSADLTVVWLDVPPSGLTILPQRYERRSETTVWYESPMGPYAALLELTADGFVSHYPGLWELTA